MIGHLLGGAGSVESAVCILTMKYGVVPPTINLENPDPECDLDYVPNVAREKKVKIALNNSFGFGGHNATLAFKALYARLIRILRSRSDAHYQHHAMNRPVLLLLLTAVLWSLGGVLIKSIEWNP